jgi:hypothetical protein
MNEFFLERKGKIAALRPRVHPSPHRRRAHPRNIAGCHQQLRLPTPVGTTRGPPAASNAGPAFFLARMWAVVTINDLVVRNNVVKVEVHFYRRVLDCSVADVFVEKNPCKDFWLRLRLVYALNLDIGPGSGFPRQSSDSSCKTLGWHFITLWGIIELPAHSMHRPNC